METLTEVTVTARQLVEGLYLLPLDLCCNCGTREGLVALETRLPLSDLIGEKEVPLAFPHCRMCAPTGRFPPPRLGRILSFFPVFFFLGVFVAGGMTSLITRGAAMTGNVIASVLLIATFLGVAVPIALFRWRPPKHPAQTTRYQAVRLRVKKTFLGKLESVTFAFTNPGYAERFRAACENATSLDG